MTIEHGMDGALGRHADIAWQELDEALADLARTPVGLVALGSDDQGFDLLRELIGVAPRAT